MELWVKRLSKDGRSTSTADYKIKMFAWLCHLTTDGLKIARWGNPCLEKKMA